MALVLLAGAWVLLFHADLVKSEPKEEEEAEVETDVPVKTGKIVKGTLHRYVTGFGVVAPAQARGGKPGRDQHDRI